MCLQSKSILKSAFLEQEEVKMKLEKRERKRQTESKQGFTEFVYHTVQFHATA